MSVLSSGVGSNSWPVTVAVFLSVVPATRYLALTWMTTVLLPSAGMVPRLQTAAEEQSGDETKVRPAGSGSSMTTCVAVSGPLLVTLIV